MTEPGTLPEGIEPSFNTAHEMQRLALGQAWRTFPHEYQARSREELVVALREHGLAVWQLARAEGAAQERARIIADIRKRWDGHEALLILDMLEATRTPPPPEAQE